MLFTVHLAVGEKSGSLWTLGCVAYRYNVELRNVQDKMRN